MSEIFEEDSDCELELLSLDRGVNVFEDHELKTSPLVTKDATTLSTNFEQRGFLGSVLSVHADGIPSTTQDPRLYMNLDAPSSGLVCGVQGSGKSHTVSCIIESSLMVNRRIGTLPAPLATVVFHFDEENGGRPCEAAYLSELKIGTGRAVNEVVVLVSPSNLRTRKRVYKGLKYVHVEALRIAEKDINAARMLSMMGADNLETIPLYLHTALSMLRDMGSDDFTYGEFRKRLSDSEFNKTQMAMLQLRLDLLDSFLQGTGGDISFFFKPGRLVIIDLSDPFVDSTTAAMLFDICLGLFIEWKSTTGKLIVLDEAHKYLTNTDANRFTKTICSIIRQQRHLAARVIVSTQEPTVVPASVLDLLSWVVCHRFSSPSWVKHLMHHLCVEEEDANDGDSDRNADRSDWGQRVMTLRTGEALLYSPASLFVSNAGRLATLGTGYAIIKSRPRLTRDGGESLLATVDRSEEAASNPFKAGLMTPASSPPSRWTPPPVDLNMAISKFDGEQDGINDSDNLKAGSSQTSGLFKLPALVQPSPTIYKPSTLSSTQYTSTLNQTTVLESTISHNALTRSVAKTAIHSTVPTTNPPLVNVLDMKAEGLSATRAFVPKYGVLVDVMTALRKDKGLSEVDISDLAQAIRSKDPNAYSGKFIAWLEGAIAAGIVGLRADIDHNRCWVTLKASIASPSKPEGSQEVSNPSLGVSTAASFSKQHNITNAIPSYEPILSVIRKFETIRADRAIPIAAVERDPATPDAVSAAGCGTFAALLTKATKDGILVTRAGCVELTASFTCLVTKPPITPPTATSSSASIQPAVAYNQLAIVPKSIAAVQNKVAPGTAASTNATTSTHISTTIPHTGTTDIKSHHSRPSPASMTTYKLLVDIMRKFYKSSGSSVVEINDLATAVREKNENAYKGKFKKWLEEAETAGIITLQTAKNNKCWITLSDSLLQTTVDPKFKVLISVIKSLSTNTGDFVLLTKVAVQFAKQSPGGYQAAGYKKFKDFIQEAAKEDLLILRGGNGTEEVSAAL